MLLSWSFLDIMVTLNSECISAFSQSKNSLCRLYVWEDICHMFSERCLMDYYMSHKIFLFYIKGIFEKRSYIKCLLGSFSSNYFVGWYHYYFNTVSRYITVTEENWGHSCFMHLVVWLSCSATSCEVLFLIDFQFLDIDNLLLLSSARTQKQFPLELKK